MRGGSQSGAKAQAGAGEAVKAGADKVVKAVYSRQGGSGPTALVADPPTARQDPYICHPKE